MTIRILTLAEVPDELHHDWLQHLRDFDAAHPGCHFKVALSAPDMTIGEMIEAMKVDPPLAFTSVVTRKP